MRAGQPRRTCWRPHTCGAPSKSLTTSASWWFASEQGGVTRSGPTQGMWAIPPLQIVGIAPRLALSARASVPSQTAQRTAIPAEPHHQSMRELQRGSQMQCALEADPCRGHSVWAAVVLGACCHWTLVGEPCSRFAWQETLRGSIWCESFACLTRSKEGKCTIRRPSHSRAGLGQ